MLPSAVTSVTFPWKIMYVQDVIIWYSVVVASYIEGLLENMYRCVCVCVCVRVRVCVSNGQDVHRSECSGSIRKKLTNSNHIVKQIICNFWIMIRLLLSGIVQCLKV